MLWIDLLSYVGLDRRKRRAGMRLTERRHEVFAAPPPSLQTAIRQLRMRVLDAHEPHGRLEFCARAQAVAALAAAQSCRPVANALAALAERLAAGSWVGTDPRPATHLALDRVEALLQPMWDQGSPDLSGEHGGEPPFGDLG